MAVESITLKTSGVVSDTQVVSFWGQIKCSPPNWSNFQFARVFRGVASFCCLVSKHGKTHAVGGFVIERGRKMIVIPVPMLSYFKMECWAWSGLFVLKILVFVLYTWLGMDWEYFIWRKNSFKQQKILNYVFIKEFDALWSFYCFNVCRLIHQDTDEKYFHGCRQMIFQYSQPKQKGNR